MVIPGWRIRLDGSVLEVGSRGGVALSWKVPDTHGRDTEILDGYRDVEERRVGDGGRQALLVPWSNRIRGARYSWGGRDWDLGPAADGTREALHGLALESGFELVEQTDARLCLRTTLSHPEYPVPLRVQATYELGHTRREGGTDEWSLHLTLRARNLGHVDAPVGLGWHPYVQWRGGRDGARVHVPAHLHVETDASLIPLTGPAAFTPLGGEGVELASPAALDDAWTGLESRDGIVSVALDHADGARTVLEAEAEVEAPPEGGSGRPAPNRPVAPEPGTDPEEAPGCAGRPGVGIVQLFTGEPLVHRAGRSLAMEYCQFMTDAVNRPELHDCLRLAPGDTRTLRARLVQTL
ncbi:MAG: hypothetical protein L0H81_05245 [Actinomyces sp.]|nr:hypothetical protein [Actinomyces sp.]MDN6793954.1 hypothetical protein [Propionibacterium sp.]